MLYSLNLLFEPFPQYVFSTKVKQDTIYTFNPLVPLIEGQAALFLHKNVLIAVFKLSHPNSIGDHQ